MEVVISIILFIISILTFSFVFIFEIVKNDNKETQVNDNTIPTRILEIVMEKNSFDNVNILIDTIIRDSIDMYNILNGVSEETYINTKMTEEMASYVFGMSMKKMTPAVKSAIGLFYKIDTNDDLEDLLKLRIKLHLINEIYQQNLPV